MRMPPTVVGKLCERGVWKLGARGPSGEFILFAVDSEHRLVPDSLTIVPLGSDHIAAVDALWDRLDEVDPVTADGEQAIRRKRIQLL